MVNEVVAEIQVNPLVRRSVPLKEQVLTCPVKEDRPLPGPVTMPPQPQTKRVMERDRVEPEDEPRVEASGQPDSEPD